MRTPRRQAGPAGNTIPVATGPASITKTWVNSKITLSLQHNPDITASGAETVTATVQVDNGTGTFVNAPDGTVVTLTIDASSTAANSTFTGGVTSTTCATSGGTCTVQINATSTGTTVVDAHATPVAGPAGNTIQVPTGTQSITKAWVNSKLTLSLQHNPDITGSGAETVTATVQVDNGTGTFVNAPDGTVVTLTIDAFEHGGELHLHRRSHLDHVREKWRHLHGSDQRHLDRHNDRRCERLAAGRTGREHDPGCDRPRVDHEDVGQLEDHALAPAQPGHHG